MMRKWFGREKSVEVWDEADASPLGDIEAAEKIRAICRSVADSAAAVAEGRPNRKPAQFERHSERYQRAAKAAMGLAMKVSDELMRDAAVREIVELCLQAADLKTARILFRAVQSPAIRDPLLREHPALAA